MKLYNFNRTNILLTMQNPWAALFILQPFRHFTYVITHFPTLPSLYLRHSSFSNPSVASLTSQFILQPFFRFSYVISSSLNSPGEPPMAESVKDWFAMRHDVEMMEWPAGSPDLNPIKNV